MGGEVHWSGVGRVRKVKCPRPGLRPGRLGWALRCPLENGAACRLASLASRSSWALKAAFSARSSSTRAFSAASSVSNGAISVRAGMTLIGRPAGRLVQGGAANQELMDVAHQETSVRLSSGRHTVLKEVLDRRRYSAVTPLKQGPQA